MAASTDNSGLQAQQQAQAAQAAKAAQQTGKVSTKPSVQFSDVLKNQQQGGSQATIRLLKNNPVAGAEVLKSALRANTGGKATTKAADNLTALNNDYNKGSKLSLSPASAASSGSASATTGSSTTAAGTTTDVTGAASGSTTADSIKASYNLMELNQDFNLQYLSLQENMQAESRQYTAMSNVSKTKSDTAKNSLSNVK